MTRSALAACALGIALGVALGGCGAPQKPGCDGMCKRNEIMTLWAQIRNWRREAHMELEPTRTDVFEWRSRSTAEAKRVCIAGQRVPPACNDVCGLADAICDNAEAICNIAAKLGARDDYAQGKCASAKASCREAKQRCCNCSTTHGSTTT